MHSQTHKTIQTRTMLKIFIECCIFFLIGVSPYIIFTKGVYISYGDYNVQNIPFLFHYYDMYHDGLPSWDWQSDLGMGFLGGYTFYGLTSPYTLISLIFPRSFLPYAITILNAVKFGVAGAAAYIYTSQYVKKDTSAHICGILYAFSGAQYFNICFHFSETISLFPLLLYSFDKLVTERRRVAFALMMAVMGFTNYYFFFGSCVFLLIYFIVKVCCKEFVINKKMFAVIAFETVIGVAMTAVVLIPSFMALIGIKRAETSIFDVSFLAYEESGTIWKIITSMFYWPEFCHNPRFFFGEQTSVASISLYIPLFSVIGVYTIMKRDMKKWYSRLCIVCLIFAFVPVLNSAFSAFNSRYYARWFFMPLLIMIMMTGKFIDDFSEFKIEKALKIMVCIMSGILLLCINVIVQAGDWYVTIELSLLSLLGLYVIYRLHNKEHGADTALKRAVCFFSVIPFALSMIYISQMKLTLDEYTDRYIDMIYNGFQPLTIDDDSFFRIVSEGSEPNDFNLIYHYPSVSFYNSMIPGSTSDFYAYVGKERVLASDLDRENYAIYGFLSVKYDLYCNEKLAGGIEVEPEHIMYKRKYFTQKSVCNRYVIYENPNFIPMGFTYDRYINIDEFEPYVAGESEIDKEESYEREKLLVKAMWLTDEQIEKYSDILTELPEELKEDTSDEAYEKDCAERKNSAAYEFTANKNGFTSRIDLERDNLVFYSVPYSKDFTAYVDGEKTEIEKVFGGLSAVMVPKGDHTITFEYKTAGLKTGAVISVVSVAVLAVYGIVVLARSKKRAEK